MLFAATLLASLLVVEAALRWLEQLEGPRSYADLELGWASESYRRFDPGARPSQPGQPRILFLGDSMIAAKERRGPVPRRLRIPQRLERTLGDRAVVGALASAGWGTDQELLAFVQKGRPFAPDVVVLAICAYNDLSNNLSNVLTPRDPRSRKPYFALEDEALVLYSARGVRLGEPGAVGLSRGRAFRSRILDRLSMGLEAVRAIAPGTEEPAAVDPRYEIFKRVERPYGEVTALAPRLSWSPQSTIDHLAAFIHEDFALNAYQWRLFEALVAELAAQVRSVDAKLVLMLLPVPIPTFDYDVRFVTGSGFEHAFDTPDGPFTLRMSEPNDRLSAIAARHDVDFFDPTRAFLARLARDAGLVQASWMRGDPHFAGPSHDVLAELLHAHLQETGVLDRGSHRTRRTRGGHAGRKLH